VATYETGILDETGARMEDSILAEVLGVSMGGKLYQNSYVRFEGKHAVTQGLAEFDIPVLAPQTLVHPRLGAQGLGRIVESLQVPGRSGCSRVAPPGEETGHPAAVVNRYGKGRSVYVPARLGEALVGGDPRLTRFFINGLRFAGGRARCSSTDPSASS